MDGERDGSRIGAGHRRRAAYVYIRQSTMTQVETHIESKERQYELVQRAVALGWRAADVVVIDDDLARSGAEATQRTGFQRLVADVGLGRVGLVLGIEVSRLARNNTDWYHLLDRTSDASGTKTISVCLHRLWSDVAVPVRNDPDPRVRELDQIVKDSSV